MEDSFARIRFRTAALAGALSWAALGTGCHTPGPSHVYAWSEAAPAAVCDVTALTGDTAKIGGQIGAAQRVVGLAYDFNTDFLCLRLEPGQRIRIFKRGEQRPVRAWSLPAELALAVPASADLAIRPRDRHLFAVHPTKPEVWEFALDGSFVRTVVLHPPAPAKIGGLAYDSGRDRLVVLFATAPAQLAALEPDGSWTPLTSLPPAATPVSLGYDAEADRFYVPLRGGGVGVFDAQGRPVGTLAGSLDVSALDAGPRSFVRVF
jgi:hypothetical protein